MTKIYRHFHQFTGTVITFTVNVRKLQVLSCVNLCNSVMSTAVTTVPINVMTTPVNFGQLLHMMFSEVKLTITRGGILGEWLTENVTPVTDKWTFRAVNVLWVLQKNGLVMMWSLLETF